MAARISESNPHAVLEGRLHLVMLTPAMQERASAVDYYNQHAIVRERSRVDPDRLARGVHRTGSVHGVVNVATFDRHEHKALAIRHDSSIGEEIAKTQAAPARLILETC